jgi:sulfite exporter TauE/SafE
MDALQNLLDTIEWPTASAFLLGLMTALSPCPLATNITAVAYIGREIQDSRKVLLNGLLYTLGRMVSYTALGLVLYFGASVFDVASLFRGWGEKLLGPLLVLAGLVLLDVIPLKIGWLGSLAEKIGQPSAKAGYLGALAVGALFALAFCPYSAFIYFGMLIPLTVASPQGLWLPPIYALATGLPVIVFAWVVAFAVGRVGFWYDRVRTFELWFRRGMSVLFLLAGLYLTFAPWL